MTFLAPLWCQSVSGDPNIAYTAQQDRALIDALCPVAGVIGAGALAVSQRASGANFSVDVAAGYAAVQGTSVAQQGKYIVCNTVAGNVTVAAAPGSGTRTDLIVAQVYDKQVDGGTTYSWAPIAVTGSVGSGTPALPDNALPLARVTVVAGQTSITSANIADLRVQASGVGNTATLTAAQQYAVQQDIIVASNAASDAQSRANSALNASEAYTNLCLNTSAPLLVTGNVMDGNWPGWDGYTRRIHQFFTVVYTTDSNGNTNVPFIQQFPNGIMSIILYAAAGPSAFTQAKLNGLTLANAGVTCRNADGSQTANATVRINVNAVGW